MNGYLSAVVLDRVFAGYSRPVGQGTARLLREYGRHDEGTEIIRVPIGPDLGLDYPNYAYDDQTV